MVLQGVSLVSRKPPFSLHQRSPSSAEFDPFCFVRHQKYRQPLFARHQEYRGKFLFRTICPSLTAPRPRWGWLGAWLGLGEVGCCVQENFRQCCGDLPSRRGIADTRRNSLLNGWRLLRPDQRSRMRHILCPAHSMLRWIKGFHTVRTAANVPDRTHAIGAVMLLSLMRTSAGCGGQGYTRPDCPIPYADLPLRRNP